MLDVTTKARINAARDILVGKVPNPISQVQQITFALIYKFMNDMDKQNIELGGKASFFAGDLAQYAWDNLITKKIDANEALTLYSKGLEELIKATNIPPLFRTMFKNAFIPYRDGETFTLFIKIIDEFHYSHSEKLGDAFEFLLSILGSQGDAGQFRTPRHIIDFMVELIDPKKNEILLDPACGTAGFLIAAYKHIIKNNSKNYNPETDKRAFEMHAQSVTEIGYGDEDKHYKGDRLQSSEKQRLDENIMGYDISPEMVQFSLVNFYLHDCKNPKIVEYDSLTSVDKWNDYADVILANPPFMTPKGGIRPHDRFGVKSNRAEVLFVDYIAEHLHKNGRAAIIVPEGVIFQSANAYKQLRQKLIDQKFLVGVISLPAGIFNPYSGVKTSILWLDRKLASKTDNIFFAKIEADGFDLGAQRRANNKNDLPAIFRAAKDYIACLEKGKTFEADAYKNVTLVAKTKIAENGDYNFSGERYVAEKVTNAKFPMVELGELVEVLDSLRKPVRKDERSSGIYPYYGATGILEYVDDFIFNERLVLVGEDGAKWQSGDKTAFLAEGKYWVNNHAHCLRPIKDKLLDIYLIEQLNHMDLSPFITGVTVPKLNQQRLKEIKIPLPPLEVQQAIVAEIEGYQTIIDSARKIVTTYKPHIELNPDWQEVELGEICELRYGYTDTARETGDARYIRITDIDENGEIKKADFKYTDINDESKSYILNKGDLVVARTGATYGKTLFFTEDYKAVFASFLIKLDFDNTKILNEYYWVFTRSEDYNDQKKKLVTGGGQPQFNANAIKLIKIPLPPLETQKQIVAEIEAEQAIINANKKLIEIFEAKIHRIIAKIWGEYEKS